MSAFGHRNAESAEVRASIEWPLFGTLWVYGGFVSDVDQHICYIGSLPN